MPFSPDYLTATDRFRKAASQSSIRNPERKFGLGDLAHAPMAAAGPGGEELTMDYARFGPLHPQSLLIVSGGLHGSEGIFGSAVQLAVLQRWAKSLPPENVGVLLIHALNPYGFAWMRRTNEDNVDLNRNFLLPGQRFDGCPPLYRKLDALLNPQRPPSRWEPFRLKAYLFIARHGLPALMQAIAGGQYEYPQGLFYGGKGPSETQQILQTKLPMWLHGVSRVLHLDFHTGLGRHGDCTLLLDSPLPPERRAWLRQYFSADALEPTTSSKTAYTTRGSLGQWCVAMFPDKEYTYLCAEFGTYPPLAVIGGLRAENQAHFWGKPDLPGTCRAKKNLKELLNPASPAWRQKAIRKSLALVDQAMGALASS